MVLAVTNSGARDPPHKTSQNHDYLNIPYSTLMDMLGFILPFPLIQEH